MKYQNKNIWISLTLAIVCIAITSLYIPQENKTHLKDRFWTIKTHKTKNCNLIILGDSRVYRGISPYAIEQILPHYKAFNFGYSNGGLNHTMYKAAEKKLKNTRKNRIVLIGASALSLNKLSSSNTQYLQEIARPYTEVFERMYLGKYMGYFGAITPEELCNKDVKKKLPKVEYTSIYHDNGWVASDKAPADTMEALPFYIKDFKKHSTSNPLIDEMCTQINEWSSKNIKVFVFRPPAAAPLVSLENSAGKYNESLIKRKVELAGGVWIDVDPTKYKTYDGSHLSEKEAQKLSIYLAQKIKAALPDK